MNTMVQHTPSRAKKQKGRNVFFRSGPVFYLEVLESSGELYIFTLACELSCVR